MQKYSVCLITCLLVFLGGCGGAQTVSRTKAPSPEQVRAVGFSPESGNSPEVDSYKSDALRLQGVETNPKIPANTRTAADSDAVLTYVDLWRWDMAMYLQSITINLYNAKTGDLLVSGRWRDSFLHAFNRGETISKELLAEMFSKIGAAKAKD